MSTWFDQAWRAYICGLRGHVVEYVAATTNALAPSRPWVCTRCGYRSKGQA